MALRMEPFVASPTGSIGRRISSLPRPSSASPHLAPAKPGFEKDRVVQRHEPVLHLQRAGVIAVEALTLQLGAEPRRHVRHHRDAAVAAGRVVGERGHVLAGELDEIRPHRLALLRDAGEIRRRVLDAGDVRQFVEPRHGRHRHVDHRARRDIVDDDGDADGVVDRLEMPVKPLLARLVVIGRDDEQGIGAGFFRVARRARPPRRCCWSRRRRSPARGRAPRRRTIPPPSCARHGTGSGFRRSSRPARGRRCRSRSASRHGRGRPPRRRRRS